MTADPAASSPLKVVFRTVAPRDAKVLKALRGEAFWGEVWRSPRLLDTVQVYLHNGLHLEPEFLIPLPMADEFYLLLRQIYNGSNDFAWAVTVVAPDRSNLAYHNEYAQVWPGPQESFLRPGYGLAGFRLSSATVAPWRRALARLEEDLNRDYESFAPHLEGLLMVPDMVRLVETITWNYPRIS